MNTNWNCGCTEEENGAIIIQIGQSGFGSSRPLVAWVFSVFNLFDHMDHIDHIDHIDLEFASFVLRRTRAGTIYAAPGHISILDPSRNHSLRIHFGRGILHAPSLFAPRGYS